jgi:pyruvate/2-oxoglutarate dehydrogenase complex dihydrolipoamide acyltransferase (E2) component
LLGYAGKLGTSDLTGGTFSLSNIGAVSYVWNTTVGTRIRKRSNIIKHFKQEICFNER